MVATLRIYRFKLTEIRSQTRCNLKPRWDIIKHSQIVFFSRMQVILRYQHAQIIKRRLRYILVTLALRIKLCCPVHCALTAHKIDKMVPLHLGPEF